MNDRVELYESLVRLGLMLVFMVAVTVGTFSLVSICQMLIQSHAVRPGVATYTRADYQ